MELGTLSSELWLRGLSSITALLLARVKMGTMILNMLPSEFEWNDLCSDWSWLLSASVSWAADLKPGKSLLSISFSGKTQKEHRKGGVRLGDRLEKSCYRAEVGEVSVDRKVGVLYLWWSRKCTRGGKLFLLYVIFCWTNPVVGRLIWQAFGCTWRRGSAWPKTYQT